MLWLQGVQAQIEYKSDFIIGVFANVIGQSVGVAFIWILFQQIRDLQGWSRPEVMLIYGFAAIPYGIFELFFNGIWSLGGHVRLGSFDRFLIRPFGSLLWILGDQPQLHGIGNAAVGLVIVNIAMINLGITWNIWNAAILVVSTFTGVLIILAINTILASVNFWFVGIGNTVLFMGQRFRDFSLYPLTIFSAPIRWLLTWVFPFGFASFYPVAIVLQRKEYQAYLYCLPFVTASFLALALYVWNIGLKRYESTGS